MKKLIITFLMTNCIVLFAITPREISLQKPNIVSEYHPSEQFKLLKLPTPYAKSLIVNPQAKKTIHDQDIIEIDLVYTRYHESQQFDQRELNEKRIAELFQLLPSLQQSKIIWKLIEQTKAITKDEAANAYHGFVIHHRKKIDYQTLSNTFQSYQNPFVSYTVHNNQNDTIKYEKSGTLIYFTANSAKHSNGNIAQGYITIMYREFRNQPEILFSGIPMTGMQNGTSFNLNSGGMYELKGFQNGIELKLSIPVKVDFMATAMLPKMNFYDLSNQNANWNFNKKITTKSKKKLRKRYVARALESKHKKRLYTLKNQESIIYHRKRLFTITNKGIRFGYARILRDVIDPNKIEENVNLVSGLSSPSFGVYNCDQVIKIQNPVAVKGKFIDKKTKQPITQQHVVYVMDMSYNAAFSFSPEEFTCSSKGKNVVLLFTEKGAIYMANQEDIKALNLNRSGAYTIAMTDVSNKIKSTEDLKKLLNI
jgi:hypothetical protein